MWTCDNSCYCEVIIVEIIYKSIWYIISYIFIYYNINSNNEVDFVNLASELRQADNKIYLF